MLSWLEHYNWIFGPNGPHPGPEDWEINNDEALDDFIENWKREQSKPAGDSSSGHRQTFTID